MALFSLMFFIYVFKILFWKLEIPIVDTLVLSIKFGLLMPLYLIGFWLISGIVRKILGFISKRFRKPKPLLPENKFIVEVTNTTFLVTNPDGTVAVLLLKDISSIIVKTNDTGPWGMDVWFIIMGQDGEFCTYPMGATNDLLALDYYATLPGFELKGMNSTENALFVCWEKEK